MSGYKTLGTHVSELAHCGRPSSPFPPASVFVSPLSLLWVLMVLTWDGFAFIFLIAY